MISIPLFLLIDKFSPKIIMFSSMELKRNIKYLTYFLLYQLSKQHQLNFFECYSDVGRNICSSMRITTKQAYKCKTAIILHP